MKVVPENIVLITVMRAMNIQTDNVFVLIKGRFLLIKIVLSAMHADLNNAPANMLTRASVMRKTALNLTTA